MDCIYLAIGKVMCIIGGGSLALLILGVIGYFTGCAWVRLSNKFRGICREESMIFEYKKHRKDFLRWVEEKDSHR